MQLYFTGSTSGGDSVPYLMALSQPGDPPLNGTTVWMNCDDHYDIDPGLGVLDCHCVPGIVQ